MSSNIKFPKEMVLEKKLTLEQRNLLEYQYQRFLNIGNISLDSNQYQLHLDDNRNVYLPKGALIYSSDVLPKTLKEISEKGILAPEFLGNKRNNNNFYCADFYKVNTDTLLSCMNKKFSKNDYSPFNKVNNKIAFVVNPSSKIGGLLYYDLLDSKFDNNKEVRDIIKYDDSLSKIINKDASAILVGIPANCISGIILGDLVTLNSKLIRELEKLFPLSYLVTRNGHIIKDRSNTIIIEDFDKVSLDLCQNEVKFKLMVSENKKLIEENEKLKHNFVNLMNSIKKNTSFYNQAKIYTELGYQIPKGLLDKLSKDELENLNDKKDKK